jgi:hypothetical protein
MIDGFVILTPILLLAIVALLGFAGCQFHAAGSGPSNVQTVVQSAAAGTKSVTAGALSLQGGELIIAAVQWGSAVALPETPALSGAAFSPVDGGGPFAWDVMSVQIFSAVNPAGNTQLTVTASLPRNSDVAWSLCVSAYDGVDEAAPFYSPQTSPLAYTGNNPQTPPLSIGSGDLVYAVAFAANSDGTFPGTNTLTAGSGFTAEFPAIKNPLVEDGGGNSPVVAQVTNSNPDPNAKGFIFAMGLKVAS